ncbi:MAG: hypothetical protein ABIM99_02160 [Candidatus Dojkabacteria bacterium]
MAKDKNKNEKNKKKGDKGNLAHDGYSSTFAAELGGITFILPYKSIQKGLGLYSIGFLSATTDLIGDQQGNDVVDMQAEMPDEITLIINEEPKTFSKVIGGDVPNAQHRDQLHVTFYQRKGRILKISRNKSSYFFEFEN